MPENFEERRKYVRVYHNFMLFFSLRGVEGSLYEMSQINNISRGGINFSSNNSIPVKSEVVIDLKTPFQKETTRLYGVVLECHAKIPEKLYSIHIEFKNVSPAAMDILVKTEKYAADQK